MSVVKQTLPIDLLTLYKNQAINNASEFCDITKQLDVEELATAYQQLRESAPHRHDRDLKYFVDHKAVIKENSNRREEHLALALWDFAQEGGELVMPDSRSLRLLDYQFPLKAQQTDKGVGKLDLFGVSSDAKACVVELKIHPIGKGRSDTPLRAFLEALAYCAIVEANASDIAEEALERYNLKLLVTEPVLIVVAPKEYWAGYVGHRESGDWWPALQRLADQLDKVLGLESHFIALRDSKFSMGLQDQKPQLLEDCTLVSLADFVLQQNESDL